MVRVSLREFSKKPEEYLKEGNLILTVYTKDKYFIKVSTHSAESADTNEIKEVKVPTQMR